MLAGGAIRLPPACGRGENYVVTATPDIASLAPEAGGASERDLDCEGGYQDPHFVEAKPELSQPAQSRPLVVAGLQLEIGWLPPLITQCGNPRIQLAALAPWTPPNLQRSWISPPVR